MTEGPICYEINAELLHYICKTLRRAADDISAHLDAEYPPESRAIYPTYERRYKNDREVVVDAIYCLEQVALVCEGRSDLPPLLKEALSQAEEELWKKRGAS